MIKLATYLFCIVWRTITSGYGCAVDFFICTQFRYSAEKIFEALQRKEMCEGARCVACIGKVRFRRSALYLNAPHLAEEHLFGTNVPLAGVQHYKCPSQSINPLPICYTTIYLPNEKKKCQKIASRQNLRAKKNICTNINSPTILCHSTLCRPVLIRHSIRRSTF